MGPWFHRLGRGVDTSPVDASPWVPRAHGREETYQQDLEDWEQIAEEVRSLTRRVVVDIDREGRPAARVGLKVRFKPFITVSRSLTLPEPSNDPAVLADAAVSLLDRVERDRPVRLLGVRLEMTEPGGRLLSWSAQAGAELADHGVDDRDQVAAGGLGDRALALVRRAPPRDLGDRGQLGGAAEPLGDRREPFEQVGQVVGDQPLVGLRRRR